MARARASGRDRPGRLLRPKGRRDRPGHQVRIGQRRKVGERHLPVRPARDRQRQAGLADPSRAGEGHQARPPGGGSRLQGQEPANGRHLFFPAHEAGGRDGEGAGGADRDGRRGRTGRPAGGRAQGLTGPAGEPQRACQALDGRRVGRPPGAPLQVGDAPQAEPSPLGQGLLR